MLLTALERDILGESLSSLANGATILLDFWGVEKWRNSIGVVASIWLFQILLLVSLD